MRLALISLLILVIPLHAADTLWIVKIKPQANFHSGHVFKVFKDLSVGPSQIGRKVDIWGTEVYRDSTACVAYRKTTRERPSLYGVDTSLVHIRYTTQHLLPINYKPGEWLFKNGEFVRSLKTKATKFIQAAIGVAGIDSARALDIWINYDTLRVSPTKVIELFPPYKDFLLQYNFDVAGVVRISLAKEFYLKIDLGKLLYMAFKKKADFDSGAISLPRVLVDEVDRTGNFKLVTMSLP